MISLTTTFEQTHGHELLRFVAAFGELAEAFSVDAYLVGGMVRDSIIGVRSGDVDIMLCGSDLATAKKFATFAKDHWREFFPEYPRPSKVISFKRYGTCKLKFTTELFLGQWEIDFASARQERYPIPGGVPEVAHGTLETDISRRDFSCNAIAFGLNPGDFGQCFDPFFGIEDTKNSLLRILHPQSFVDDPARLIRAIRFMRRFEFEMEEETKKHYREAMSKKLLKTLPVGRLCDELEKALAEHLSVEIKCVLNEEGVVEQLKEIARSDLRGSDRELLSKVVSRLEG